MAKSRHTHKRSSFFDKTRRFLVFSVAHCRQFKSCVMSLFFLECCEQLWHVFFAGRLQAVRHLFRQFDSTVSGHAVSYAVYLQASFFRQFDISGIAG